MPGSNSRRIALNKIISIGSTLLLSVSAAAAFAQAPAASTPVVPSAQAAPRHLNRPLTADEQKYNDAVHLFTQAISDKSSAEIATDITDLQAVENNSEFGDAHSLLGYLYLLQNTPDSLSKSVSELQSAVSLKPDDIAAHNNLALALNNSNPPRYDDAAAQYKAILDILAKHPASDAPTQSQSAAILQSTKYQVSWATALAQAGHNDDALTQFGLLDDTLAPALPGLQGDDRTFTANFYKNYGYVAMKGNQTAKAADAMNKAATLNPKDAGVWLNAGELYAQLGSQDEAITALTNAVGPGVDPALDPKYAYDAHFALAQAHIAKGEINQAINEFDIASRLQPQNAVPFYDKGVLQEQLHLNADAITSYKSALAIDSGDLQTQTALGLLYASEGNVADAASLLSEAAPRLPQEQPADRIKAAVVYARLADMQLQQKDAADANQSRLQALALNPDNTKLRLVLADSYLAQKQYVTALVQYDIAAQALPNDPTIQNQRGVVYENLKQYPKALAAFKRAFALDPRSAEVQNNIGVVEELLGRRAEAIVAYKRALALNPRLAEARANLTSLTKP